MRTACANERRLLVVTLMLVLVLEGAMPAFAKGGKKTFKEGIRFAENKQWDKAAERLALAVAEEPSNAEFQLHHQRALVNAAIMLVERGDRLAAQKDYVAAYNSYRQAYALDSTNEVAALKMKRMLEAQAAPKSAPPVAGRPEQNTSDLKRPVMPVSFMPDNVANKPVAVELPARRGNSKKIDVIFRGTNLLSSIEQVAQTIHLNVVFDQQVETTMKARMISIELRDVTAGEALEFILQTNYLTYVQVGLRTIVITNDNQQSRARYEQMSVRPFYVKNADINDLRTTITQTVGTKQIVSSKQLNALVVRDTKTNLELIESLIASLDKSKSEVLIDINLYEVSKNDLLELGNQFAANSGSGLSLKAAGGVGQERSVREKQPPLMLTGPFAFALGMPASTLSIFQETGRTKLLAATQVHILDNEQHQIRIGQRVPVKTGSAQLSPSVRRLRPLPERRMDSTRLTRLHMKTWASTSICSLRFSRTRCR